MYIYVHIYSYTCIYVGASMFNSNLCNNLQYVHSHSYTHTHTHTHTCMPAAHAQSLQPADAAPTLPAAPDSERNSQKSALWLFVW